MIEKASIEVDLKGKSLEKGTVINTKLAGSTKLSFNLISTGACSEFVIIRKSALGF